MITFPKPTTYNDSHKYISKISTQLPPVADAYLELMYELFSNFFKIIYEEMKK